MFKFLVMQTKFLNQNDICTREKEYSVSRVGVLIQGMGSWGSGHSLLVDVQTLKVPPTIISDLLLGFICFILPECSLICNRCNGHKGLVTNYGEGGHKTGVGYVKFYPYEKGGRKKL